MQRKRVKLWVGLLCFCLLMGSVRVSAWADAAQGTRENETQNEYYFLSGQNENRMLIWERKDIPRTIDAWIYDEENSDGTEKKDLKVTDVSISQQYEWGEEDREPLKENDERTLIRLEGSAEEGWYLEADEMGSIDLKVTFQEDNSETSYTDTFRIDCVDEIYWVEWELPNDKNTMLTNASCEVKTRVTRNYYDYANNENIYGATVENYKLVIQDSWYKFSEETEEESSSLFEAKVENHKISFTSKKLEGWGHLYIEVKDGDDNWLTGETLDMDVWSDYYDIQPSKIKNPSLKETLNFKDEAMKLYRYNKNNSTGKYITTVTDTGYASSTGKIIPVGTNENKRIRFRMEYDSDIFALSTEQKEEDFLPISNLTRISVNGGDVRLIGEEYSENDEEWYEFVRRDYWFDNLDYYTGLDNTSNHNADCVFSDATAKFTLDKSNLEDKKDNYQITIALGTYDGDRDTFTPFKWDNTGAEEMDRYFSYIYAKDSTEDIEAIVLNGKKINEFYKDNRDSFRDDKWFDIHVQVTVGDTIVSDDYHGIELKDSWYDYDYPCSVPGDDTMLRTESIWIDKSMHVSYENSAHPYGIEEDIEITNVSFATEEEVKKAVEDSEDIEVESSGVSIKKHDDNWEIHGDEEGSAWIKVTYKPVEGDTGLNYTCIRIWVRSGYWRLDPSYEDGTGDMLPNSEKTVGVILKWRQVTDTGSITETIYGSDWHYITLNTYEDENGVEQQIYDTNLVDVTVAEDCKTFTVKSKDEQGWSTRIWFHVGMGEETIETYAEIGVWDSYLNIEPDELLDSHGEKIAPNVGATFDILDDAYGVKLHQYYVDEVNGEKVNKDKVVEVKYTDSKLSDADIAKESAEDNFDLRMRYRLEYDDGVMEPTEETKDRAVPVLKRKSIDGAWVCLIAENLEKDEEGNLTWREYRRKDYQLNSLVYVDGLRGEGETWIYNNETEYTLYLNGDILNAQGRSVDWNLYQWNEKTEKYDTPLDNTDNQYFEVYSYDDKIIALNGEKLFELRGENEDEVNLRLAYTIKAGEEGAERQIAADDVSINVRAAIYDYNYSYMCEEDNEEDFVDLFPGETITLDGVATFYREDGEYPYGNREEVKAECSLRSNDGNKTISFNSKGDRGWKIEALNEGTAEVRVVYKKAKSDPDDSQEEGIIYVRFRVAEEGMLLQSFKDKEKNYYLVQGDEITYEASYGTVVCEDGEYKVTPNEKATYTWELTTSNGEDPYKYVEETKLSGSKIKLKLKKDSDGDVSIYVKAKATVGEETNEKQMAFYIYGDEYEYYDVTMDEVITEPGKTVELPISVIRYSSEHPKGEKIENPKITFDMFDQNMLSISGTTATIKVESLKQEDPIETTEFRAKVLLDEEEEYYWRAMLSIKICNHKFEETSHEDPTCEGEGVSHQACTKCKKTKDVTIAAVGHKEVPDPAVDPTCTDSGLTAGSHCDVCKKTLVKQQKVEALGHKTETVVTAATPKKKGKKVEKCTVCGKEVKTTVIASPKTVKFSKDGILTYNKKKQRASVIAVYDTAGKAIPAVNYKVSYPSKSKDIGRYAVTITFKGNYSGTLTATYDIAPKGTSLKSVAAGSKRFTAKWKKLTTNTTGYMIQYSTDKNFVKGVKTVTVQKNKTTAATVKKLSAKKKYYVRVCTYKNVKYKGKTVKVCSAWSAAKNVNTKK